MAERRQIEHTEVLRLAKLLLLFVERQHMLLDFPAATDLDRTIVDPEDLLKAS